MLPIARPESPDAKTVESSDNSDAFHDTALFLNSVVDYGETTNKKHASDKAIVAGPTHSRKKLGAWDALTKEQSEHINMQVKGMLPQYKDDPKGMEDEVRKAAKLKEEEKVRCQKVDDRHLEQLQILQSLGNRWQEYAKIVEILEPFPSTKFSDAMATEIARVRQQLRRLAGHMEDTTGIAGRQNTTTNAHSNSEDT